MMFLDVFIIFFNVLHTIISGSDFIQHITIIMDRLLKKKISLVAAAAAMARTYYGWSSKKRRRTPATQNLLPSFLSVV
jgi:hypothetical protein